MLQIEQVDMAFPAPGGAPTAVLRECSLQVANGEFVAVLGRSGGGKSTLLRIVGGFLQPTAGRVLLDGVPVTGPGPERTMVFQNFDQLLPWYTLRGNIEWALRRTGAEPDRKKAALRAKEMLAKTGLSGFEERWPHTLSGGQKQRGALARALASRPEVLLCDEPTSALDPLTTKSVLELLKSINKKLGVTIIIITHELSVVRTICNRMVVIDNGGVVEQGFTREIFENPQSSVARLLLGKEV
mgnify:CR=1 FL=1